MELKTSLFCLVALALLCTVYTQDLIDQHQCRSQVDRFYHSLRKWETLDTLQTLASDATFVINADKTYVPYGGEYKGTTQIQNFFNILFSKAILISLKEGSAVMGANDTYGVFTTENYKVRAAINGEGVVFQQESLDLFIFNENCLITKYVKFFDSYAAAKALSENLQSFAEPHLAPKFAGIEEDFAVDRSEAIVLVKAFYRLAATYPDKITQIMSKMGTIVFPGSSQTIPFAGQWINKFEEIDDYITKRKALNITREPVAWNGVDTFIISRSRVIHFWKETGVSPKTKNSYTVYVAEVFEIIVSDKGLKIGRITETLDSMPVYRVFREHRCQKTFLDYYSAVHSGDLKAATDLFTADAVVHVPGARELTYTGTFKGKSAITKQLQNFKSQYHMSETFPRTKVKTPEMLVAVLDQSLTTRPSAKNTARTYHRSTGIAMFKFDKQCQIEYLGVFGNNHPAIKASRDQTTSYPDAAPLKDAKVPYESDINERAATDLVFEFYRRIQAGQSVENLLTKNAVVYVPGDTSVVPFSGVWHGAKQISRFVSKKRAAVTYSRKPWTPVKGSALTVVSDQGRVLVFWNETGMLQANNRLAYSQGVIDYFVITQQFANDGKPDLKIARLTQYGDTAPVAKAFEDNRPATITTSLLYFILIIVGTALVSFLLATILACCIANRNSDAKHYDKVDNVDLSTNLLQHSNPNPGRSIVPSVHN